MGFEFYLDGLRVKFLPIETLFAKEARDWVRLWRKAPRLYRTGGMSEITV
ncbi:hypothetical protein [Caldanaerobius polysaccharolyticus]|nr:hypothetical protein [Caldanaerobius polysaccharolyticus]